MKRRRLIIISGVIVVAIAAVIGLRSSDADAIAMASGRAQLAPLPSSVQGCHVVTKGSAFTREFVITSTAPPEDVQRWLDASPGPASARQSVSNGVRVYAITPGGGAQFAEVRVDEETGKVTIRTYWS